MAPYIGTSTSRIDGRAKVTGAAKYAGEFNVPGLVHGSVVTSTIAKGHIRRIDPGDALRVEGVIDVLTHQHRPPMAGTDQAYKDDVAPDGAPFRPLYDDKIKFSHQPIALVLAESAEAARFAAALVRVEYDQEAHATDMLRQRDEAVAVPAAKTPFDTLFMPPKPRGDAEKALAAAKTRHDGEYYTPTEHHNPMEPFAATVIWDGGGKLTVYDKTQGVQNVQRYICGVFAMKPEDVRVLSPFTGGGFGVGLRPQYEVVLAVLGALALKRSTRVVLTRQQMYGLGHRPATIQRVALGATSDGKLDAIMHEATSITSRYENFFRQETAWSGLLYKSDTAKHGHKLAHLDLATSCDMRCPSAATGVYALECAMDELAVALKVDPLELRLRCYSERDQNTNRPYSSKALRACYREGAKAFGWEKRSPAPRSMRDGSELVGWGMATGIWDAFQAPIAVRIVLAANGHAEVACATSDMLSRRHVTAFSRPVLASTREASTSWACRDERCSKVTNGSANKMANGLSTIPSVTTVATHTSTKSWCRLCLPNISRRTLAPGSEPATATNTNRLFTAHCTPKQTATASTASTDHRLAATGDRGGILLSSWKARCALPYDRLMAAAVNTRRCGATFRTRHWNSASRGNGASRANTGGSRIAIGSSQTPKTSLVISADSPIRRVRSTVTALHAISSPNTSRSWGRTVATWAAVRPITAASAQTTTATNATSQRGSWINCHPRRRRASWRTRLRQLPCIYAPAG